MVSVDHNLDWKTPDFKGGALVDLNAGHVSAALVDDAGNPVEVYNFPCGTYGKSSDQAQDAVRKVTAKIAVLAKQLGVPVVSELLDFSEKKKTLKDRADARYARMLSSFAYSELAPKTRHVWSKWNRLNKEYQKALAGLGSSWRKPRPKRESTPATGRSTLPGGSGRNLAGGADNRSMASRNTRDVSAENRFSHVARGGRCARNQFLK